MQKMYLVNGDHDRVNRSYYKPYGHAIELRPLGHFLDHVHGWVDSKNLIEWLSDQTTDTYSACIDDWENEIMFKKEGECVIISGDFGEYGAFIEVKYEIAALQRLALTWIDLIEKDRRPEVVECIKDSNGFTFISCKGTQVTV